MAEAATSNYLYVRIPRGHENVCTTLKEPRDMTLNELFLIALLPLP